MDISSTLFENIDVITKIKIKFIKKKEIKMVVCWGMGNHSEKLGTIIFGLKQTNKQAKNTFSRC